VIRQRIVYPQEADLGHNINGGELVTLGFALVALVWYGFGVDLQAVASEGSVELFLLLNPGPGMMFD
jgi:hypothetical protein